jgi:hypothetical protein
MPAKSKKRRPQYNKAKRQHTAPAAQAAVNSTAAPAAVKAAVSKAPVSTAASAAEYPYFSSELKRIAVVTGAILVILIVLAFIIK